MEARYLAKELGSVNPESDYPCCGDLTMVEACSFASALNTNSLDPDELHWGHIENYKGYLTAGWCIIDQEI